MKEKELWPLIKKVTGFARRLEDGLSDGIPDILATIKARNPPGSILLIESKARCIGQTLGLSPAQAKIGAALADEGAPYIVLVLRHPHEMHGGRKAKPIDIIGFVPSLWGLGFEETRDALLNHKGLVTDPGTIRNSWGSHRSGGNVICPWNVPDAEKEMALEGFLRDAV